MRSTSLAPAGFLISRIETGLPPTSIVSTRPKTARDRLQPARGSAPGGRRERSAGGDRGERVVDVVEAGQGQLELELALRRPHPQPRAGHPAQLDLGRGDVRGGAVGLAVRAGVVAEVADEGALVRVGSAAAAAVLGVVRVLELGQRLARVLDPEVGDARAATEVAVAPEVGDQRVVGVEGELAARRPASRPAPPTRRRGARARRSGRAGRGRGCRARAGGGGAAAATRGSQASSSSNRPSSPRCSSSAVATPQCMFEPARLWTGSRPAAAEDRRDHPRRRRLAVGRADHDRAAARAGCRAARSRRVPSAAAAARAGWCRRRGRWCG